LSGAAVFLDLDGTLAPFAPRPQDVGPDRRRTELLGRLQQALDGRLAVVSGRAMDEIDRILESAVVCAAGVHGLQRRSLAGRLQGTPAHPTLDSARRRLEAYARPRPGLFVENKSLSVALHYRGAPDRASETRAFAALVAGDTGLKLQEGTMVVELRTPGSDKGDVVRTFMTEPPFADSTPIFVGDDLTDEDGFRVAAELGGFGVLVGPVRPTAAKARLPDVGRVLQWLDTSIDTGVFRLEALR
jgi:trehalose 6-phosphate phosphatase